MKIFFITIILFICSSLSIYSQNEKYSTKINWELYRVSGKNVSLLFPKLPVLVSESNICNQTQTDKYAVYADEIVYGLNISSKLDEKVPDFCSPKRKFDENSFKFRINEVKTQLQTKESKTVKINNLEAESIKGELLNFWLVNDYKNKQWFELWTANSDENSKVVKDFINSIKIGEKPKGIEIYEGSSRTMGDLIPNQINEKIMGNNKNSEESDSNFSNKESSEKKENNNKGETHSIRLITNPPPKYTDLARKNNTQGSCKLRVTFYSNGAIGSITPVTTLPDGLTEEAIAAAQKIIFLPARRNGVKQHITKIVQYTFTIY